MQGNFSALSAEKQSRILHAAMAEFSARGFQKASTNEMVKKAGISKGSLFHYFTSKRALYEYLYRYNLQLFMEEFLPRLGTLPTDVLERWSSFARLKMELVAHHPLMLEFMLGAAREEDSGVQAFLAGQKTDFTAEFMSLLNKGLDVSRFRAGLDVPKALEIIWWTLDGFGQKMQQSASAEELQDPVYRQNCLLEMERYLAVLKQSFYVTE